MTKLSNCLIRSAAALTLSLLGAVIVSMPASAQSYPSKSITYVIPYNPGGESDVTARFQEPYFKEITGQDVVIQYKPGAGGATAWAQLNTYEPDGYTIMNVNFPHAILQPSIKDVGYQTEDVMPAYVFHYTPDAILVNADSPFQTLQDMIDFAESNPGMLTFSGSGTNSANHLAATRFNQLTDTLTTYIPFKGSSPAIAALLGNQVRAAMSYTTQAIKAGEQVRVLAIATPERLDTFPGVPTFKELGFDYVAGAYRGVTLPKDAPADVRQALSDIIGQINANQEFQQKMQDNGYVVVDVPSSEMEQFISDRRADYASGIEALQANK